MPGARVGGICGGHSIPRHTDPRRPDRHALTDPGGPIIRIEIVGGAGLIGVGNTLGLTPVLLSAILDAQLNAHGLACSVRHADGAVVEVQVTGFLRAFQPYIARRLRLGLFEHGVEANVAWVWTVRPW